MRRLLFALLTLAIVVASIVGLWRYLASDELGAALVVDEVEGDVGLAGADGRVMPAVPGAVVTSGARLQTGDSGRAVLALGAETRIRLSAATTVTVRAVDAEGVTLDLEDGALQATVRPGHGALRVAAGSREAVALDADIAVGVSDGDLVVEASRGEVAVQGVPGVAMVQAGERVTVPDGGQPLLTPIPDDLLLAVDWPSQPRMREEHTVVVGRTEPGARVRLRGADGVKDVVAASDGAFRAEIALVEGDNEVVVEARNALGHLVRVEGLLVRDTRGPRLERLEVRPQ